MTAYINYTHSLLALIFIFLIKTCSITATTCLHLFFSIILRHVPQLALVLRAARSLGTHLWAAEIFVVRGKRENGFFLSWEFDDC